MDKKLRNIIHQAFALMLIVTASATYGNIQKVMFSSIHEENPDFTVNAYTVMAIGSTSFIVVNWLSPSIMNVTGPKIAMIIGALAEEFGILQLLWPQNWLIYFSIILGWSTMALLWTGEGVYYTLNSTATTISRNAGILWSILQLKRIFGNLVVYFKFEGMTHIDKETRTMVLLIIAGINGLGFILLTLLPRAKIDTSTMTEKEKDEQSSPFKVLIASFKLIFTKKILILSLVFIYAGCQATFLTLIYGTCIGFTNKFGIKAKQQVGLSGIVIGIGEITGGIFGAKCTRWGRTPVIIVGLLVHLLAYFLIFLNLPNGCPTSETDEAAFMDSSVTLALFCSFLLGVGDACVLTQIMSIIGGTYVYNSATAFAIFKLFDGIGGILFLCFVSSWGLYRQLGVLASIAILGNTAFIYVEHLVRKKTSKQETGTELETCILAEKIVI